MDEFLGRPLAYWIEIDKDLKIKNTDELVAEICKLRAKVSFYESRINGMAKFMALNLEMV